MEIGNMKVTYKVNNYTYGRIKNNKNLWTDIIDVKQIDHWHKQMTFDNVIDEFEKARLDKYVCYKGVVL